MIYLSVTATLLLAARVRALEVSAEPATENNSDSSNVNANDEIREIGGQILSSQQIQTQASIDRFFSKAFRFGKVPENLKVGDFL